MEIPKSGASDEFNNELSCLNGEIVSLEKQISAEQLEAENNIKPLTLELARIREEKRQYASKNDFDSVQDCIRRENNLKFKINAQQNRCSILKDELFRLNHKKADLERRIKLEEDKIKRNNEILSKMNAVLDSYRKTQSLKQAAVDSNIHPSNAEQWYDWGKNGFSETYSYFYSKIIEIDENFKDMEAQKLKDKMDSVIDAYKKTDCLKEASKMAGVSYDTVQYWYEWGSKGFGEENAYFFNELKKLEM